MKSSFPLQPRNMCSTLTYQDVCWQTLIRIHSKLFWSSFKPHTLNQNNNVKDSEPLMIEHRHLHFYWSFYYENGRCECNGLLLVIFSSKASAFTRYCTTILNNDCTNLLCFYSNLLHCISSFSKEKLHYLRSCECTYIYIYMYICFLKAWCLQDMLCTAYTLTLTKQ